MRLSLDDLRHRTVLDSTGLAIGEVEALLFDSDTWHVGILRVKLRRDVTEQAGAHAPMFRKAHIEIPTAMVQSIGDAVLLTTPLQSLRDEAYAERVAPA